MGRALSEIVGQVAEAERPDGLAALLDSAVTEHAPEAEVRKLLEAAGVEADAALAAARADGDIFEGDDLDAGTLQSTAPVLLEAIGDGEQVGNALTRRYRAVLLRPGRAKGAGRRFYAPKMVEANVAALGGATMFFNHEDMPKILARGHGSRDPRDVCGYVQPDTWYDPTFTEPDDKKNALLPGAAMGHADLLIEAADRVDALPQAFKLSICMDPTRVRVGRTPTGELAPCVEGIVPQSGSVDLITGVAGAGGKLLQRLRESAETRYGSGHVDLAAIDDDRLIEAARARPAVVAALLEPPPPDPEEDEVTDIGSLVEAMQSDPDAAAKLAEALAGSPAFDALVEAKVSEREQDIRADAAAESNRALELRDFRDEAHRLIEARAATHGGILTPAYTADLTERYMLRDGRHPTPALDVYDALDEQGEVVKPALERLRECVEVDICREEAKLRESAPTRVRDLAAPPPDAGDGGGGAPPERPKDPTAERLGLDSDRVREFQGV